MDNQKNSNSQYRFVSMKHRGVESPFQEADEDYYIDTRWNAFRLVPVTEQSSEGPLVLYTNPEHIHPDYSEEELCEEEGTTVAERKLNLHCALAVVEHFGIDVKYTNQRAIAELVQNGDFIKKYAFPKSHNEPEKVIFKGEEMKREEFAQRFDNFISLISS